MIRVDLNADVGEGFGAYSIGDDPGLMSHITSASVACGFHAGDPGTMRSAILLALQHHVAVGAHPAFPDLHGFGRREMEMSARDVENLVTYQIGALAALAGAEGVGLQHVKPHGALFNMAARDSVLAGAIARATAAVDRGLILFGLPGSQLIAAGTRAGLRTASEGFADRAYRPDGSLVPRTQPGAVIHDAESVVARALMMVREGVVIAADGARVALKVDTVGVHGDTPAAAELARRVREALTQAGVTVRAVGAP